MSEDELMPQALYSAEAEEAVLGCCMAQPSEVIAEVVEHLTKSDFFIPAHQDIFATLRDMDAARQPIDVMTIHQWLTDRKLAEEVGSPGILGDLLTGFATHLNVGSYIKIVKEKSILRAMQDACTAIVRDIIDMPDSVASVLDRAESRIMAITNPRGDSQIMDARAACQDFRRYLEEVEKGEAVPLLPTKIKPIDDLIGGLPCPAYFVIAGPPGGGKSAMMMTLQENWSSDGIGVGIFSLEMTTRKLMQRRVARVAQMNSRLMNWPLDEFAKSDVNRALDHIECTPFWIDPTSNLAPSDLRARTLKMVRMGAKVIILDYVQLLRGSSDRDRRVDQLTEASRMISVIQKEMGVLFIGLAQITRDAQKKGDYKTFDLADCAAIANDARGILFLEQDDSVSGAQDHDIPLIGRFAKMSDGPAGDVRLSFNKLHQKIA
jgi:replicative DNA helicase